MAEEWDGKTERRKGPHDCIQKISINDILHNMNTIRDSIVRQEVALNAYMKVQNEKQGEIYDLMFGKDMKGGIVMKLGIHSASLDRLWWFVGVLVFLILGTSVKVWFFK